MVICRPAGDRATISANATSAVPGPTAAGSGAGVVTPGGRVAVSTVLTRATAACDLLVGDGLTPSACPGSSALSGPVLDSMAGNGIGIDPQVNSVLGHHVDVGEWNGHVLVAKQVASLQRQVCDVVGARVDHE